MRLIVLLVFICGFLGAPALCAAGAFLHPCDCGESIECDHEDDCADDPCVDVFAPRETGTDLVPPAMPVSGLLDDLSVDPRADARPARAPRVVPLLNLPCPDSALPLLS